MSIAVRPLQEQDLADADRIFRLAFGTFLGLPEPLAFAGDGDWVGTRFHADPSAALAAEVDGAFAGSNFVTRWGSFGFFGPLTVRPDLWDRGVAKRLLEPTMELFERGQTTHRGLFTFSHSPKHHALYQKFGFYPRFLTAVMAKPVERASARPVACFSTLAENEREGTRRASRALTGSLYAGLDVTPEIDSVAGQRLGDTLLLEDGGNLVGLAVCHAGKGTEAGTGRCYVKFGAVGAGSRAAERFERLLDACEAFAAGAGASTLVAGTNLAREPAYRAMLRRGFRTELVGVAMQSGNEPGPNRPEVFAIDDWR
ncbi:MAG: GNAT family N-acetyltransferase [Candidatus Binatia bacterium]